MVVAWAKPRWLRPLLSRAKASGRWADHVLHGEPLPLLRDEVPVLALVGIEGEGGLGFLAIVERGQEVLGGGGHLFRRGGDRAQAEQGGEDQRRLHAVSVVRGDARTQGKKRDARGQLPVHCEVPPIFPP